MSQSQSTQSTQDPIELSLETLCQMFNNWLSLDQAEDDFFASFSDKFNEEFDA